MSDAVAIVQELTFRQQISDTLQHASRSLPPAEQIQARELMASFDQQLNSADGNSAETKREIVRKTVKVYGETKGALESAKDGEVESCHLLLQHVIASNFEGAEYAEVVKQVIEAVRAGGEAASEAGRTSKVEAASRVLLNTYNLLPATSPLRLTALLALIRVLGASEDLSTLPLTPSTLSAAVAEWSVSDADKVAFLQQAAAVYEKAGDLAHALSFTLLALERSLDAKVAEHALALALAQPNCFELDDLLKVQGTRDVLKGPASELVDLFTKVDELEAVPKAAQWTASNGAFVSGLGVAGLDADEVLRKVRLVALATLAARSATKEIAYAELAKALSVEEAEVEAWVIDAIRAGLLQARLSQPLAVVRVTSVSSRATRRFGSDEWKLLERRLTEWKSAVTEARAVVDDAEGIAAQGPITNQRRANKGERRSKDSKEEGQKEGAEEGA